MESAFAVLKQYSRRYAGAPRKKRTHADVRSRFVCSNAGCPAPAVFSLATFILEEAFMRTWLQNAWSNWSSKFLNRSAKFGVTGILSLLVTNGLIARQTSEAGGEANLKLPDLSSVRLLGGAIDGHKLLLWGILICIFGLLFGLTIFSRLKNLPVHRSMRDISELIYETCKTYLITQGKFLLILEIFIGVIIAFYFGVLQSMETFKVAIILAFSLVGIAGSYGVAGFGIRVNTFANSRTAFASLRGKPFPCYAIPLQAGMSIGMMLKIGRASCRER